VVAQGENEHGGVQHISHEEIEDQIQEGLLQPEAFLESDVCLLEPDCEEIRPRWDCKPRSTFLEKKPRNSAKGPYTSSKCNQDAKRFGVVLCACVGLYTFQDSNHDGQNDDFADRADSKSEV
jgi:hypothetical protein